MQKEAKARIKINKLLEQADWRFFDNEKDKNLSVRFKELIKDANFVTVSVKRF